MPKNVLSSFKPRDHAEAVALFRAEVVGSLSRRQLDRGELAAELRLLSEKRYVPPGSSRSRSFGASTLERWLYRYKAGGIEALRPQPRSDRGIARKLTQEARTLLLDIRREHPTASAALILRTLQRDGRLPAGIVDETTLRRLFAAHDLSRQSAFRERPSRVRLRWQAERPGALFHADVCHGAPLLVGERKLPVRIHAFLDDASRFVPRLDVFATEREDDMLTLLVATLRQWGFADALYLDNGSTYSGNLLRLACERLGITLLHAAPYDPEARGKMERFWLTLRSQCLDHLGALSSLHDLRVRLHAYLDEHYHKAPHAGLFGRAPAVVWAEGLDREPLHRISEAQLADALTVRSRHRVRKDNTLSIGGQLWQTDRGFMAGRLVTVGRCHLSPAPPPWIELDGKKLVLARVDPTANAKTRRVHLPLPAPSAVPFAPADALLDQWLHRPTPTSTDDEEIF